MKRLMVCAAVAAIILCLPVVHASTLTGTSGNLDLVLGGNLVQFAPTGANNLTIVGPFAGAPVGVPFPAEVTMLNLVGPPVVFQQGTYIIGLQLKPLTNSLGTVTPTSPTTFSSFFDVFFAATFNKTGAGSSGNSGDVLGEFGGIPGITNCVNGSTPTCSLAQALTLTGSFDVAGNALRDVTLAPAAVPEPGAFSLGGSALLLLAFRRKK